MTAAISSTFPGDYHSALLALWLMLATVLLQSLIAMVAHRRQKRYIPGVIDAQLGHESFVFRSHRTFQNSLENLPIMAGSLLLAMFSHFDPHWLGILGWTWALARIGHMALYYAIATEKNPSPRSYCFAIGLLANVMLIGMLGMHLLSQA